MTRLFLADVSPLEDPAAYARLYADASGERRLAADSYRFEKDRRLSIGAAALLDIGLREYGLREKDMSYAHSEYGKPFFSNAPELHFNISHSSTKVAVAFSDGEVGCDIEEIAGFDRELAEACLSRVEYDKLMTLEGPDSRRIAFFRQWVLKESYMKATGMGLSLPPHSFTISSAAPKEVARPSLDGVKDAEFSFLEPYSFDGYACALCYRPETGTPGIVRLRF